MAYTPGTHGRSMGEGLFVRSIRHAQSVTLEVGVLILDRCLFVRAVAVVMVLCSFEVVALWSKEDTVVRCC